MAKAIDIRIDKSSAEYVMSILNFLVLLDDKTRNDFLHFLEGARFVASLTTTQANAPSSA